MKASTLLLLRSSVVALAIGAMVPLAGCSSQDDGQASTSSSQAAPLGDLSEFQRIAQDVDQLVKAGELSNARARIKDLELAWDGAEAGLKPRNATQWHSLDDAIDAALSALRASSPKQADCQSAMTALLERLNQLSTSKS